MRGDDSFIFIGCFCVTVVVAFVSVFLKALVEFVLAGIVGFSSFNASNTLEWITDTQIVSSFFCVLFLLHPRLFQCVLSVFLYFLRFFSVRVGVGFFCVFCFIPVVFRFFVSNCATSDLQMVTSFFPESFMIVVYSFVFITAVRGANMSKSSPRLFLDLYCVAYSPPASVFKSLQSSESP